MGDNLLAVNLGTGKTALDIAVGQYHTAVIEMTVLSRPG